MPRPARFTRDDWAAAALALLAEGGPAAVAVRAGRGPARRLEVQLLLAVPEPAGPPRGRPAHLGTAADRRGPPRPGRDRRPSRTAAAPGPRRLRRDPARRPGPPPAHRARRPGRRRRGETGHRAAHRRHRSSLRRTRPARPPGPPPRKRSLRRLPRHRRPPPGQRRPHRPGRIPHRPANSLRHPLESQPGAGALASTGFPTATDLAKPTRPIVIRQLIRDVCPPADVRQVQKPADHMTGGNARICRIEGVRSAHVHA